MAFLAACGGGGGGGGDGAAAPAAAAPSAVSSPISRVFVAGDSLADVGTFGLKATVQSSSNPAARLPDLSGDSSRARPGRRRPVQRLLQHGPALVRHACGLHRLRGRRGAGGEPDHARRLAVAVLAGAPAGGGGGCQRRRVAGRRPGRGGRRRQRRSRRGRRLRRRARRRRDAAVFLALLAQQLSASTIAQALASRTASRSRPASTCRRWPRRTGTP
jgi:hypothetical protein